MFRFILPALLLLGGTAALSADSKGYAAREAAKDKLDLDKQLSGLVAGKPRSCIDQSRYRDSTRVGDTILYMNGRSDIMRNDTSGGCMGLRRGDTIVTRSYSGQLCRGDIVQTVDLVGHFPTGSCSFGDFVPYHKP